MLKPSHLVAATSFLDELIVTGDFDEGALLAINRILAGENNRPVVNVLVERYGKWLNVSPTAEIAAVTVFGRQSSALIVGSRELLSSLQGSDMRFLGQGVDFVVQKHQWEILNHVKDQEIRKALVGDLCRYLEEEVPELAKSKREDVPAIDLFIFAGRIQEPL